MLCKNFRFISAMTFELLFNQQKIFIEEKKKKILNVKNNFLEEGNLIFIYFL